LVCGRIGQRHAAHIHHAGTLAAVCDIDVAKVEELGKKYSTHIYTNIDDLLMAEKNLDVVAICTPNGLHAEHSVKALKAGIHVLCEKPMALSIKECGEMIKTAEK
jgi:predicted dehydrogenase